MSACCITPANSRVHASRLTHHELVAESGVSPDDLLVMSQPSLIPAPSPHQERAVRFELTMTGFADRRLNQLGYARVPLELRAGIEPALSRWQGDVMPLDQRSPGRFRIANLEFQICRRVAIRNSRFAIRHSQFFGTGGGIRTLINWFLRPVPLPDWATPVHFKFRIA